MSTLDVSKLQVAIIDSPNDLKFEQLYQCYSKLFTLESERESKASLQAILARNYKPSAVKERSKETWLYLHNDAGKIVGATNFDVFAGNTSTEIDGTIQVIYVFVTQEFRQAGVFTRLNAEMLKAAMEYINSTTPTAKTALNILIFAEQNSPSKMPADKYISDNAAAGIDPIIRRNVFEKAGYKTLDLPYIQPPLSKNQSACTYLDMVVKAAPNTKSIPSAAIAEHLSRFFRLSFPEGTTLNHPDLAVTKQSLEAQSNIILLNKQS